MSISVVVGNPKANSRTFHAALLVAERLTRAPADVVVDVVTLGAGLLSWSDPAVTDAIAKVSGTDYLVCASPTYMKAGRCRPARARGRTPTASGTG